METGELPQQLRHACVAASRIWARQFERREGGNRRREGANIGYRFADSTDLTVRAGNCALIVGSPSDPRSIDATVRFRM